MPPKQVDVIPHNTEKVEEDLFLRTQKEVKRILDFMNEEDKEKVILYTDLYTKRVIEKDWRLQNQVREDQIVARKKVESFRDGILWFLGISGGIVGIVLSIIIAKVYFFPPYTQEEWMQHEISQLQEEHQQEIEKLRANLPSTAVWKVDSDALLEGDHYPFRTMTLNDGTVCFRRDTSASIVCSLPN